jgi:hypothetical protein
MNAMGVFQGMPESLDMIIIFRVEIFPTDKLEFRPQTQGITISSCFATISRKRIL